MGGGASSLTRLRKAIVIRAYNLRAADETVDDQFRRFAQRGGDNVLYISLEDIRRSLNMETKEYEWVDHLFQHLFGAQVATIKYADFIKFLESGKLPTGGVLDGVPAEGKLPTRAVSAAPARSATPPVPPRVRRSSSPTASVAPPTLTSSGSYRSIADAASIRIERVGGRSRDAAAAEGRGAAGAADGVAAEGEEGEPEVIHINLSAAVTNPHSLPESVKLQTAGPVFAPRSTGRDPAGDEEGEEEHEYTLIVHPSSSSSKLTAGDSPVKPLWRKRETVRQERTVHYTTIDANGEQQELVERETTQSEVLHMECKETGEFAHRETTQYEQLETFNEEVVAESKGAEEYVHLKSREDEYHYMESTMPNKGGDPAAGDAEGQPGEGHPGDDPGHHGPPPEFPPGSAEAEAAEAEQRALEAEYAEAYNLYNQKQQQAAREGQAGADEDEDGGRGEPSSRGRYRAPSPHPPPFSDEAVDGGYGFERDASSHRERQRAQDAFAYAAMEEDERDMFSPGEGANLHSPEPVYGERVVLDEEEDGQPGRDDGEARRRASRDHLFAPPTPKAGPEGGDSAPWPIGESAGVGRSPRLADLGAPAAQAGFLTRSSSYESLHEID